MPKEIQSKTGNAQIDRMGHTATSKHGSDPNLKVRGNQTPRDLRVK